MQPGQYRDQINAAVQAAPVFAESSHHALGGGDAQGDQQRHGRQGKQDVRPFNEFRREEGGVHPQNKHPISGDVQQGVKQGE